MPVYGSVPLLPKRVFWRLNEWAKLRLREWFVRHRGVVSPCSLCGWWGGRLGRRRLSAAAAPANNLASAVAPPHLDGRVPAAVAALGADVHARRQEVVEDVLALGEEPSLDGGVDDLKHGWAAPAGRGAAGRRRSARRQRANKAALARSAGGGAGERTQCRRAALPYIPTMGWTPSPGRSGSRCSWGCRCCS